MIDQQKLSQNHLDIGTLPLVVTAIQNNSSKTTGILDIEKVAKEKGYEKITPLGIWYLGHKYHEYKGEYGQEYYYTYELLSQKLEKIKRINLPDGSNLESPRYVGANDKNIIITHRPFFSVFKTYTLFGMDGAYYPLIGENGNMTKKRLVIDKKGDILLIQKSNGPIGMAEIEGYIASHVGSNGEVSSNRIEITEMDFKSE